MKEYINDFEKWCADCVTITDKETGEQVPFILNAPQRRVLALLEDIRLKEKPIRVIMLKARQWGGSTLVQTYMAWIQLVRRTGWSSIICGHVRDASSNIQGMYSRLLREYPERLKAGNPKDWVFVPYEKSRNISYIPARDCRIATATALSPDGVRSGNYAMAHLSEVAFWGDGDWATASNIVRSVAGSIVRLPETIVVMESTANGKNNYFYYEWQRAVAGESDKTPIFVPWHEIEIYSRRVKAEEKEKLLKSLDEYENRLLADGVSIEHVAWYHDKRREYTSHSAMMAEYPSTPEEAFETSARRLLPADVTDKIRISEFSPQIADVAATVVYSTDRVNAVCRGIVCNNRIYFSADKLLPADSLRDTLHTAVAVAGGSQIVVAHNPADDSPHAAWFVSTARRRDLSLWCDDEGNEIFELSKLRLSELIDCYCDAALSDKICENAKSLISAMTTLHHPPMSLLSASNAMFTSISGNTKLPSSEVDERFVAEVFVAHALIVHLLMPMLTQKKISPTDFY